MADLRHEANEYAQRAWTRVREHHTRTGHWNPILEREYLSAEQMVRDVEAAEAMTEAQLDALHEATQGNLDDLIALDPPWLPDIPLALDSYWNRGA
jgi:hypothetical protein